MSQLGSSDSHFNIIFIHITSCTLEGSRIRKMFFVKFLLCGLFLTLVDGQADQQHQWFEDTLDDFLRNGDASADIQISTCKISSKELVSTASATAARVLKGVCNPSEIEERFSTMESNFEDQMSGLKGILTRVEDRIVEQNNELRRLKRLVTIGALKTKVGGSSAGNGGGSTVVDNNPNHRPAYIPPVPHRAEEVVEDEDDARFHENTLHLRNGHVGPRSDEISRQNSSVIFDPNGRRVFVYYWVVTGISYKLNNWHNKQVLRSNYFYTYPGGYKMYMKILPRYTTNSMYIHVGLTKGQFDDSIPWPFTLKMKVQVLNQEEQGGRGQDLNSRLWDPKELCSGSNWRKPTFGDNPECVGLGFPHEVINVPEFVWNDRIIIKLNVYLDS